MNFLKTLLAVLVGLLLFTGIMFFVFLGFLSVMSKKETVVVKDKTVLSLKFNLPLTEREYEDPFADLPIFPGRISSSIGMIEMKQAIERAKTDPKIEGIYIEAPYVISGFGKIEEIREALEDFEKSGKFVIAYSEFSTEGGYYIASVANKVYLNPAGIFEFNGLTAELLFLKDMFKKLEIDPLIFRVGQYKSAVEPFIRSDMSDENRQQYTSFLNSIYTEMISDIARTRNINSDSLRSISDNMSAKNPKDAKALGLVDDLMYEDQVKSEIRGKLGLNEDAKINFLSYSKYNKSFTSKYSSEKIAVIVASGDIVMGEGEQDNIGSDVFAKDIREARNNDRVKAIVLRVNSPGGNYIASDVIWREISEAVKVKPVIASMSDYAASGGYYIAMACDTIIADPNTITGSIGVFRIQFTMQDFLKNKLGITSDRVNTGKYSDMNTIFRPMSEAEKEIIQKEVEDTYSAFVAKAAQGRNLPEEEIRKLGSGRVWTGSQAKENGLVDLLGDYDDAIKLAAQMAGIEDYALIYYPEQKTLLQQFFSDVSEETRITALRKEMGIMYPYLEQLRKLQNMEGVQARLPVDITIY